MLKRSEDALSTDELIIQLAPSVIDHFAEKGAVDFRVLVNEPQKLWVFVRFFKSANHRKDFEMLKSCAANAGLECVGGGMNQNNVWIEVLTPVCAGSPSLPRAGVVVPFRKRSDLRP